MLLAAHDEDGSGMSDQQLRDEVMTLFLAGHETTALTLAWSWYLLGQNPEAERDFTRSWALCSAIAMPRLPDLSR
jgi:cytochrome P450